jgi:hypothetical protein
MTSELKVLLAAVFLLCSSTPAMAQALQNSAVGKEVRVTLRDDVRITGKLITLTNSDVVIRQKRNSNDTRQPLANVRVVETVSHATRNFALIGAGAGLVIALATDLCGSGAPYGSGQEPACISAKPALIVGGSALLGAVIGAALDHSHRRTLYRAPSRSAQLVPLVFQSGAGFRVTVSW